MVSKLVFDSLWFVILTWHINLKLGRQDVVSAPVQTMQNKQKRQVEDRAI